ncbi:MAG: NfeD family protein [Deltaproteobacteria bacterium]|nr:NfeD family protein [Deltaproteobacteria bacterium]
MQPWILWCSFAVLLFLVEIVSPGAFYFAPLGVGALIAAAVSLTGLAWWVPWTVFVACSIALLFASRPLAHRLTRGHSRPSNVDALLGQRGRVMEPIDALKGTGLVKIGGETWRATADEAIAAESAIEVLSVDGTRLVVKRI